MPVQAIDNYSDFVEERRAGVIVVLAERKEDSTLTISRHRAVDERTASRATGVHAGTQLRRWLEPKAAHGGIQTDPRI